MGKAAGLQSVNSVCGGAGKVTYYDYRINTVNSRPCLRLEDLCPNVGDR